ncbi:MAG: NUDIX domain-containing protein [Pseudomonadota bacterium]|nr:NUDIX domain-containing protein [Pseudomonadota bacterium]
MSIAIFRNGRVLLVRRSKAPFRGLWSLPGGSRHAGETLEAAARRELQEETALKADALRFIEFHEPVLHDPQGDIKTPFVLAVFAGVANTGSALAGDDAEAVQWARPDALDAGSMTPDAPAIIARAHAAITGSQG